MNALIHLIVNKKKNRNRVKSSMRRLGKEKNKEPKNKFYILKKRKKERKGFQNVHSFNSILTEAVVQIGQKTKQKTAILITSSIHSVKKKTKKNQSNIYIYYNIPICFLGIIIMRKYIM